MAALGVALPLELDSMDGFVMIKNIQKLLNSNGLCSSYTELGRFLTSVANHDIEHINGDRYIPSGIRAIAQGGHLSQEGSDNILTLTQKQ